MSTVNSGAPIIYLDFSLSNSEYRSEFQHRMKLWKFYIVQSGVCMYHNYRDNNTEKTINREKKLARDSENKWLVQTGYGSINIIIVITTKSVEIWTEKCFVKSRRADESGRRCCANVWDGMRWCSLLNINFTFLSLLLFFRLLRYGFKLVFVCLFSFLMKTNS